MPSPYMSYSTSSHQAPIHSHFSYPSPASCLSSSTPAAALASEAVDTYGYRPLHRMASNNLAIGAEALLRAGADPQVRVWRLIALVLVDH